MHMGSIAKSIRNNRKSRCKCSTISVPKPTCTRSVSAGVPSSLRGPLEEPLVRGLCFRKGHCTSFCASVYDSSPPCTPSPWCCCLFFLLLLPYSLGIVLNHQFILGHYRSRRLNLYHCLLLYMFLALLSSLSLSLSLSLARLLLSLFVSR